MPFRPPSLALVACSEGAPPLHSHDGEVNWVQIDVGEDANDLDHFLNHQERLKIAMALH